MQNPVIIQAYFWLVLDVPLLPASSSSSSSWGFRFSFSGFLGGPPKKSPMPFCQVGVGRGHTGLPPAYLPFAVNEDVKSRTAFCTTVRRGGRELTRSGTLAAGWSVGRGGGQRLPGSRSCNSCNHNHTGEDPVIIHLKKIKINKSRHYCNSLVK